MENTTVETKKGFFQNDPLLVCSMFAFYGICIVGAIALVFWGLFRREQTISVNSTATAVKSATEQANTTATAAARTTEQAQYKNIDHFDTNANHWLTGPQNNDYWIGTTNIKDGIYLWDITEVKQTFIYWADYSPGKSVEDFDVYVDSQIQESKSNKVCTGIIFRRSSKGWDQGGYTFTVCNSAFFDFSYHDEKGWQNLSEWKYSPVIQPADWNRIEVSARGGHFTFSINNSMVLEMTDDKQSIGDLALFVEIDDKNPAKVSFDNFGFQSG